MAADYPKALIEVYCFGHFDEYCKHAELIIEKAKISLLVDYGINVSVRQVDYPGFIPSLYKSHPSWSLDNTLRSGVVRVVINKTYSLSNEELTEESVVSLVLRSIVKSSSEAIREAEFTGEVSPLLGDVPAV